MRDFIWKIAGADLQILKVSGKESKHNFLLVGIFFGLVNILIFGGFFGLFWGIFGSLLIGLTTALLLTFLMANIYRLNMMSLDPPSLPAPRSNGSIKAAVIMRYSIVFIFAVFVAKMFETSVFGHLVDSELHQQVIRSGKIFNKFEESQMFIAHAKLLNKEYPIVWGLTVLIIFIFLYPIYLKRKLFSGQEYFRIKYRIDTNLVKQDYAKAMEELKSIHVRNYLNYQNLKNDHELGKFIPEEYLDLFYSIPEGKYMDPPFNTKLINKRIHLESHDDFMKLDWY